MAYLVLMDGPAKGQRFELPPAGEITLGRSPDNAVVIDDPSVSSSHAIITPRAEGFQLLDNASTNGTRVNDASVTEAVLFRGDVITFGNIPAMLEGDDVPARDGDPALGGGIERTMPDFRPRTTRSSKAVPRPKDFAQRRDSNRLWKGLIFLIVIAVVVAIAYFVLTLRSA